MDPPPKRRYNSTMGKLVVLWGGTERLKTTRGMAASAFTIVVILGSLTDSQSGSAALIPILVLSPLIWWLWWWAAGAARAIWESLVAGNPPEVKVGRPWQSSSVRKQLREDANGEIFVDRGGILLRERYWFIATGTPPIRLSPEEYRYAVSHQDEEPVLVATHRDRHFWWYQDAIYWTNNVEYASRDIRALLFARKQQRQRELDHAHQLMATAASPAARKRDPVPREVKLAVWRRDEGRCVECGSDFEIQYDHIIPFSMGGANTVENLQLLCARCNQQKGGRL